MHQLFKKSRKGDAFFRAVAAGSGQTLQLFFQIFGFFPFALFVLQQFSHFFEKYLPCLGDRPARLLSSTDRIETNLDFID